MQSTSSENQQAVIDEVLGGRANFDLIHRASVVKACRLKRRRDLENQPPASFDNYEEGQYVEVEPNLVAHLRDLLESPQSYSFGVSKSCIPVFGVRLRFAEIDRVVDINLCFDCDILGVTQDGNPVGGGNFDHARSNLVAMCKKVFPHDTEIQQLKPKH